MSTDCLATKRPTIRFCVCQINDGKILDCKKLISHSSWQVQI
jgi:hypothetical protein